MPLSEKMERDVVDVEREQQGHQPPRHQSNCGASRVARPSQFTECHWPQIVPFRRESFKHSSSCFFYTDGSTIRKTLPFPSSLSNSIRPLCCSTDRLAMAKPRP